MTSPNRDRIYGQSQVALALRPVQGRGKAAHVVRRIAYCTGMAAASLLLTSCGFLSGLACFGTPSPLHLTLEPEALGLSPGASGSVLTSVEGLSEGCFPSATAVGVHEIDLPEGFAVEPVVLTAQERSGVVVVTASPAVEPGTYVLPLRAFAYHSNRAELGVTVAAP